MTFTLLSFNLLHFISTPYNHSLTHAWFYLRYKIRKLYKALCCPFSYCFEGCEFPPSLSLFRFSLLCRKPVVRIFSTKYARSFCSHLGGVFLCFMCGRHFLFLVQLYQMSLFLWLCINVYILQLWGML